MKDNIKIIMLNEFEKQVDALFSSGSNNRDFKYVVGLINNLINSWKSCRFDIENKGNEFNRVNILDNSNNLRIMFPLWFRNQFGQGCQIEGDANNLSLLFQCVNNGTLRIILRGVDYKNLNHVRCPIYINFTTFKVNDELIFDEDKLIWHDEPYYFEILSNDKEIFDVSLEFKTIFDYYPFFLTLFNNINNVEELNNQYNLFKDQIKFIRFFEHFEEINNSSAEIYNFMKNANQLDLGEYGDYLSSHDSFLSYYTNYSNQLEIDNKIKLLENKFNSKIEFLENKLQNYERILDSNNVLFNTIFLDYSLKPNKLLYNVQKLCLELLSFVGNLCNKYGIPWWLDYGTLLGAIRHENFIPWDDDIDVGMMRKDYHRFIEIIYDEINENDLNDHIDVGYRWRKYDGKEINSFLQFYMRDEKIDGNLLLAGVDVFPYDFMENYDESTFGESYNVSTRNFYKTLCKGSEFHSLYMGLDYDVVIDNYYNELNLTYGENNFIIPGVEGAFGYGANLYELMILKYSDVFPLKKSKFNEYVFPVPNNSHSHLRKIYGNGYMSVPKNIRTHYRLNSLRDLPNINTLLEEKIQILRETNIKLK